MFDQWLRRFKDRLLEPVCRRLGRRLHPNLISLAAFAVGLASAWEAAQGRTGLALGLWFANRTLDGLDGTAARVHGLQSDFGGYLDILLDFAVYTAVPIALVYAHPAPATLWAAVFLLGTFYLNSASWMYLSAVVERRRQGAGAEGELTTVTMPAGIVAGTETIAFYALFIAFPAHLATLFGVMGLLVCVNVVQRLWWAWRHL